MSCFSQNAERVNAMEYNNGKYNWDFFQNMIDDLKTKPASNNQE